MTDMERYGSLPEQVKEEINLLKARVLRLELEVETLKNKDSIVPFEKQPNLESNITSIKPEMLHVMDEHDETCIYCGIPNKEITIKNYICERRGTFANLTNIPKIKDSIVKSTLTVDQAMRKGLCRICEKPIEWFPCVTNYGTEYSHEQCLPPQPKVEKTGDNTFRGQNS